MSVEAAISKVTNDIDDDSISDRLFSSEDEVTSTDHELESNSSAALTSSTTQSTLGSTSACSRTVSPINRPTILSVLRPPRSSELSRKRIIDRNPPRGKKRAKGPTRHSDPKSITPEKRLVDPRFKDECLMVSNKKLFCRACREEISVKASIITNHIKSAKHMSSKSRLDKKQKKDVEIAEALKAYDVAENPVGENLPEQHRLYRLQVVRTFLLAGVPLNKLCVFKDLLEEHAYRLSDRRHMSDMIPFILQQEKEQIKREINGKPISVTFDGTSRLGEVFVIVVRLVCEWSIKQRLIRLQLMAKSMTGDEIARTVIGSLSTEFGIESDQVIGIMHDCASTNNVALRTLKIIYPNVLGIGCFSHTLNRVGDRFQAACANDFTTYWVSLFSHSSKAKFLWKERTGLTIDSYCPTRWWSKWEIMSQLVSVFADIEPFLKSSDDFSGNTRARLLEYFVSPTKLNSLKVELAAIADAGKPFVEATYQLESDEPVVLECYDIVSSLSVAVKMENYPNVNAVVKSIANGKNDVHLKWMRHARECIKPAMKYFDDHLKAELMDIPMKAFKAARYFSPHYTKKIEPECADLASLLNLPFISSSVLSELRDEFPKYTTLAADVSSSYSSLKFWKDHALSIPKWSNAAQKVFLLQPSSASAERVFSIFNNTFGKKQLTSLEDYLETSVMLQYNERNDAIDK